jgi:hypothetical protein
MVLKGCLSIIAGRVEYKNIRVWTLKEEGVAD